MTTLTKPMTHTILGEEFEYDELRDIAMYGAQGGVSGFTYSSDLADKYDTNTDLIDKLIIELGFSMGDIFTEKGFETLQEYKEWACWVYLEMEAARITEV